MFGWYVFGVQIPPHKMFGSLGLYHMLLSNLEDWSKTTLLYVSSPNKVAMFFFSAIWDWPYGAPIHESNCYIDLPTFIHGHGKMASTQTPP